jgi:hypothetical protein
MQPKGPLAFSQEPATSPYPKPHEYTSTGEPAFEIALGSTIIHLLGYVQDLYGKALTSVRLHSSQYLRAARCPQPAKLDLNMCVFTHSALRTFSGQQPLKVGDLCQPQGCKCRYLILSTVILSARKPHTQLTGVFNYEQPPTPSPTLGQVRVYNIVFACMTNLWCPCRISCL